MQHEHPHVHDDHHQQEGGRGLETAAQRDEKVGGNIALGEAGGNAFMDKEYPLLDRIKRVTVTSVNRR